MNDTTQADTVESIAADIAQGQAVRRLIKTEEAWYASSAGGVRPANVTREWSIGVDSTGGGTYGEWTLAWHRLGGQDVLRVEAFSDCFTAMAASGFLEALIDLRDVNDPDAVAEFLFLLGFRDLTARTR